MRIGWNTNNPPEEIDKYLVTTDYGSLEIAEWTNVYWFWNKSYGDWHWRCSQHSKVIAWMPLPKEYEVAR